MSNGINDRQNSERVIHKLRAQGYLYTISERFEWTIVIVSVIIVVLFSYMRILWPKNVVLSNVATLYGVIATISVLLLGVKQGSIKEKAAKIQQEIDIEIFQLKWDNCICDKHPSTDDVAYYCKKNKEEGKYRNWYNVAIDKMPLNEARILGMAQNVTFDNSIRNIFIYCIYIVWLMLTSLIVIIPISVNLGMLDFLIFIIVPIMPIIVWSIKLVISNKSDITKLERMKTICDVLWQKSKAGERINDTEFQSLQNCIYLYRKSAYKIPDYFFSFGHQKIETEYDYIIQERLLQN